jgi:hypothetical protein
MTPRRLIGRVAQRRSKRGCERGDLSQSIRCRNLGVDRHNVPKSTRPAQHSKIFLTGSSHASWIPYEALRVLVRLCGACAGITFGRTPWVRSGRCESSDEPVEWVQGARRCRDAGTRRSRSSGS